MGAGYSPADFSFIGAVGEPFKVRASILANASKMPHDEQSIVVLLGRNGLY